MPRSIIRLFVIILNLLLATTVYATETPEFYNISTAGAALLIEKNRDNPDFVILDIRTRDEYKTGHIQNAVLLDFYSKTFSKDLAGLEKDKTYFIYCRSGRRTGLTMNLMYQMKFTRVFNLEKGLRHWKKERRPLVKE